MKTSTKLSVISFTLFTAFFSINGLSQKTNNLLQGDTRGETAILNWRASLEHVRIKYKASKEDFATFKRFKAPALEKLKESLYPNFSMGAVADPASLSAIMKGIEKNIAALYADFLNTKKQYPSSVAEYTHSFNPVTAQACDSSGCTNINFNEGTLNTWYGYYGDNESNSSRDITNIIGGPLGAVTEGCNDPTSLAYMVTDCGYTTYPTDYQITLTSSGNDLVAPAIPRVSPWSTSGHSVMLGDSQIVGSGVAILSKTFYVTAATANFSYEYAVLLMNPKTHTHIEQPFFSVVVLDNAGDTIPNCGSYSVISGPGIPGFDSTRSFKALCAEGHPVVYYRNWSRVNVPLKNYIGQCVTVVFEVADCSPGGHFGYAYVDADCAPLVISSNEKAICPNSTAILSGTAGEASYSWTGPTNGIITNDTLQNITVDSAGTYTLVITPATGAACKDTIFYTITKDPIKATAAIISNSTGCKNDGSATVNAANGVGAYTYAWSTNPAQTTDTATGLSAGTYTVTVSDYDGCSPSALVIITEPPLLTATIGSVTDPSCNTIGSATIAATGGTQPYTYSWASGGTNATETGLAVGTYTVTVTDKNGCTSTTDVVITQAPQLTATIGTPQSSNCTTPTGSVVVTATGGTSPYTYLWSPNGGSTKTGTELSAGTYTVTITDKNGCVATATATITNPVLVISTTFSLATIIQGTDTTLTVTGAGDVSNIWTSTPPSTINCSDPPLCSTVTVSPTSTTTYTVVGTDAEGCSDQQEITLLIELPCFDPVIPNVFTPGNSGTSGFNNVLYIKTTNITGWSILIFDRWGKEMFSSINPNEYWDGTTKSGAAASEGVYYYIIKASCQGTTYDKSGFVQLIR